VFFRPEAWKLIFGVDGTVMGVLVVGLVAEGGVVRGGAVVVVVAVTGWLEVVAASESNKYLFLIWI
jgi:hypothetical protein